MLATLGKDAFDDKEWIFEIKWDGYRAIGEVTKDSVKLYSRNGISFHEKFHPITEALSTIETPMVLDGEVVVTDEDGKPSFQLLQQFEDNPDLPIRYQVFDILELNGEDLTQRPLLERKKLLKSMLPKHPMLKYCEHIETDGKSFFDVAVKHDLEGMIAKRADSLYHEGKRSPDWLKIKHHKIEDVIICGYTPPQGSRKYFGSLILGIHDKKGVLKHAGNVGTGFNEAGLKSLYDRLQQIKLNESPFAGKKRELAGAIWVKPELVCSVKFTEWTGATSLRHPVFVGLREDLSSKEIKKPTAMTKKEAEAKSELKTVKKVKKSTGDNDQDRKIGGQTLHFSNLNKVYWPEEGITKGQVIQYYESMAKWILPYLKDRPESLRRNPNGIVDEGFFHKDAGDKAPDWVQSFEVHSESNNKEIDYIICNDVATLLYLNNLGCIEINPWFSTIKAPEKPSYMVMDLDPSDKNTFEDVIETALVVKAILDKAGVDCYCKTSGASGLHIYVPLGAKYSYDQSKQFAELIAHLTVEQLPQLCTTERSLNKRNGKLYVDFLQNRRGQTLACAYSLRPKAGATVSTPLQWEEVQPGLHPSQFTMFTILERVEKVGDLFKPVLGKGIDLMKALESLSS